MWPPPSPQKKRHRQKRDLTDHAVCRPACGPFSSANANPSSRNSPPSRSSLANLAQFRHASDRRAEQHDPSGIQGHSLPTSAATLNRKSWKDGACPTPWPSSRTSFPVCTSTWSRRANPAARWCRVLRRMATHFQQFAEVQGKFTTAMIYPLIVCCVGIGLVLFFIYFMLPQFIDMFDGLQRRVAAAHAHAHLRSATCLHPLLVAARFSSLLIDFRHFQALSRPRQKAGANWTNGR